MLNPQRLQEYKEDAHNSSIQPYVALSIPSALGRVRALFLPQFPCPMLRIPILRCGTNLFHRKATTKQCSTGRLGALRMMQRQ